jgi:pimeloyl-ACP methyl ester carboxylesterase
MTPPTLVLLPGLMCDATVWAAQRAALAQVRCLVPGYDDLGSIPGMARSVLAQVDSEQFALAGHSMGGRVALEVARLAPQRVTRVALLDTGLDPLAAGEAGAAERRQRLALLQVARERGMEAMARQWARGMVHPARTQGPLFEAVVAMVGRHGADAFASQIQALLGRPDAHEVFARLRCPVLLACGRQDVWSPLSRHEQMQRERPASRLAVVEDSGHMSTMEQPAVVAQLLADWLHQEA